MTALDRLTGVERMIGIRGADQWLHCGFARQGPAGLALEGGDVLLAAGPAAAPPAPGLDPAAPPGAGAGRAGMTLDRMGRLYRADPEAGAVLVHSLARQDVTRLAEAAPGKALPDAENLGPARPFCLAVTGDDHLIVLGEGDARLHVYDLLAGRYRGAHDLPRQGLDLACHGGRVHVLLAPPSAWMGFSLCEAPRQLHWPQALDAASRLAFAPDGRAFVLCDAGGPQARLVEIGRPRRAIAPLSVLALPGATEIALLARPGAVELVAAKAQGQPLDRHLLAPEGVQRLASLEGRGYDGRGLLALPEGRALFFGRFGAADPRPMRASPQRRRFVPSGEVLAFRLDSGRAGNRWGRLFLEACLPDGTAIRPEVGTSDVDDEAPPLPRIAPANLANPPTLAAAALAILPSDARYDRKGAWQEVGLVKRAPGEGHFAVYEAPILAPPGRYLWLRLHLTGSGSSTPRLRAVLAERQGHDWLNHLPRAFARRDRDSEGFLQAMLSPIAGLLAEADGQALARHRLISPTSAPVEALPWLGEMLGLPVEPEWPEQVARRMLSEARGLLERRGTPAGLRRMLEILTGARVTIVEAFRLRAGGGLGGEQAQGSQAVLGAGFRVGGGLTEGETALAGREGEETAPDGAIARHAHRFTVLVHAQLSPEVEKAARRLLDRHRPAHTLYRLCTVDAGLRAGLGGLVGITSLVGPTSGLPPAVLGSAVLGRGSLLGRGGLAPDQFGEDAP